MGVTLLALSDIAVIGTMRMYETLLAWLAKFASSKPTEIDIVDLSGPIASFVNTNVDIFRSATASALGSEATGQ